TESPLEKNVRRQIRPRRAARYTVAKGKQGKADISTLQESGHFYLALTALRVVDIRHHAPEDSTAKHKYRLRRLRVERA
ncbi:MAG: hypothetical protein Q8L80_03255, partial [Gallionella sp.]|nr:hypothetical protein [Gallionella sp.]